jgi:hypothetical protein
MERPLRWLAGVSLAGVLAAIFSFERIDLLQKIVLWACAVIFGLLFLQMLRTARRRRISWRKDDIVFEPQLAKPIMALYEEREWTLPTHPLIRYPLTFSLIGTMYWVLVLNQMNLPGYWLIMLVLHALVCLWCWRQPLLLVLIVALGVSLLAVIGWIASLPAGVIAAIAAGLVLAVILTLWELRKRKIRNELDA